MSLRARNGRFGASAALVFLLGVSGLAIFTSLGFWQLDRAREKQALVDAFAVGSTGTVDATGRGLGELARYQRVRLRGAYDASRQVLLDNMPSADGRPGYRVLTPFERADGAGWVLVDRGWVPLGPTRQDRPAIDVDGLTREVSGRLDELPRPGVRLGPAEAPGSTGWPRVMLFPTADDIATVLGRPVEPRLILLDAGVADGFERQWRPSPRLGAERHRAYAVQWFALALATIVLVAVLGLRRDPPAEEQRR